MVDNDMPGALTLRPPGAPLAALVHTKYENSGPYGFGEEDFFYVFPIVSLIVSLRELLTPRGGAIYDPRGMLGRIYVNLHITMLHTKYRSLG